MSLIVEMPGRNHNSPLADVRSMKWSELRERLRIEEHGLHELSYMSGMFSEKSDERYNEWAEATEEFRNIRALKQELARRWRLILNVAAIVLGLIGLVAGWLFYDTYWKYRQCFTSEGVCVDPMLDTTFTDSSFVYGVIAGMLMLASLGSFVIGHHLGKR